MIRFLARPLTRRVRNLYDWLDERASLRSLVRKGLYEAVPVRGAWFYSLGSATLVLIILQLVTGIFLTMLYVPSVTNLTVNALQPGEGRSDMNFIGGGVRFDAGVRNLRLQAAAE